MDEVTQELRDQLKSALRRIDEAKSRLLRPAETHLVLTAANELAKTLGPLKAVPAVLTKFGIDARSPKEVAAYTSFLNIALAPETLPSPTPHVPRVLVERRGPYDEPKPNPVEFQRDLEERFP
ncbi:MAG: hypothetical protein WC050_03820 [Candidatus Paceibacterota bacterium]